MTKTNGIFVFSIKFKKTFFFKMLNDIEKISNFDFCFFLARNLNLFPKLFILYSEKFNFSTLTFNIIVIALQLDKDFTAMMNQSNILALKIQFLQWFVYSPIWL